MELTLKDFCIVKMTAANRPAIYCRIEVSTDSTTIVRNLPEIITVSTETNICDYFFL